MDLLVSELEMGVSGEAMCVLSWENSRGVLGETTEPRLSWSFRYAEATPTSLTCTCGHLMCPCNHPVSSLAGTS